MLLLKLLIEQLLFARWFVEAILFVDGRYIATSIMIIDKQNAGIATISEDT